MLKTSDVAENFIYYLDAERFTIDRTGSKMLEIIGACFIADKPFIFGTPNDAYIQAEIDWYESQSTNVNDIEYPNGVPAAWKHSANKHGETNSNYGYLIYSDKYYNQCGQVLDELLMNGDTTRRATMVYTRPSIWEEYKEHDKNDFICTNAVSYYIRDDQLHAVVQMRSNDVVFGYKNDYAWQKYVLDNLVLDYNDLSDQEDITAGDIIWQVQNLHVYERHFDLVK
jgi:thymidylate synthase